MEPPSRCLWVPFDWAMRHELGSKAGLSPADISCYLRQVIEICSVILRFNKFLTNTLLINTVKQSDSKICVSIRSMDRISRYRSVEVGHGPHAIRGWNEFRLRCRGQSWRSPGWTKFRVAESQPVRKIRTCDKASPACAVMLHLRACYVSKAAILTISVPSVPVENRSPA